MIPFKKENYYVGFWFVGGTDKDWLACVYREQGQITWQLVHRFRYHNDASADPFDGKDKKNFYSGMVDGAKKDEKQIIADMTKLADVVGLQFGVKPDFVEISGDGDRALFRLAMQPWAHVKTGKMPEAETERK